MRRLLTTSAALGATLVLAACGGGGSGSSDSATSASSSRTTVAVKQVDGIGRVLVDASGKALYSSDVEADGNVRCTGACTSFWEPVDASMKQSKSASADLNLDLGVVKRPDGTDQLTFNGLPLYRFTEEGAGQLQGDGFVDDFEGTHFEWAAATTSASSGSNGSSSPSPY
jgi:predicted lipoprotein with Yx(FWY)xxD motif